MLVWGRDADSVGNDKSSHLLLNSLDLGEWQYDLCIRRVRFSARDALTSVIHPKMLAWKQTWFSETYSRPCTRISFDSAHP
jgi:hypothetical protein